MKFLVVLTVLFIGVTAMDEEFIKSTRARVRAAGEECVTEEKAQMSDLEIINSFNIPDSHEGRCVLFCIHKKFNIQNADGSINHEGALETFDVVKDVDQEWHEKVLRAFNACVETPSDPDVCVYSAKLSMCFLEQAKKEGIHELIVE